MIGKVYESLVNVSTEADERGDAGIFYTPRTEIDLMCRLALVDHLTNHVGDKHKNLLSELVFALEPHEKQMADTAAAEAGLWDALAERLREVTALDPACGSGSFLVGMLHVLDDLQCRVAGQTGARESAYERKKRIIGQSLYGVDVMDWAAHVAELRMWLALIIDAEFTQEELWNRNEPLLPHFSFKIRTGDSLVQEIGGLSLANPRNLRGQVSPALKARVTKLKNEKLKFYHNDPTRKFNSMRELEQEELNLFRDLIDDHRAHLESEIHRLEKAIEQPAAEQIELLTGDVKRQARQMSLKELENLKQLEAARANLERVQTARQSLKTAKDVPFVWDIAFVEVFADERGGFDLVIGNPPYVRQESIADPHLPREKVTTENKKAYKLKLQRAVYEAFPQFFGFNQKTGTARHKLDAKSDLYIYFYFLSLPLLNLKGAFCFITSNSWLDVGYGADLQEFLLRRCHVKLVIDNAAKRSFESADVNTVITLLSPPTAKMHADDATNPCLEQTARFVMFKTGFENALSPVLFEEIEEAAERKQTPEFRVFPISQRQLLTDGMEAPSDTDEVVPTRGTTKRGKAGAPLVKAPQYNGNKWGGKYLRAPEIYWTVIEKGRNYLSRFSDVASVRFGLKSGANEFFYLDDEKQVNWRIEKQYLGNRILFSLKEVRSIADPMEQLRYRFFKCYKPKSELRGTRALKYIEWGEEQGFHLRPSCQSRRLWYSIGNNWKPAPLIFPAKVGERMVVVENEAGIIEDKKLYGVTPLEGIEVPALAASLNSTWTRLYMDLTCSQLTGAQAIADINVEVVEALMIPNPELFKSKEAKSAYNAMRKRPICPRVADEIKQADRREVDDALFKVIRLTAKESEAVYEAVETLVRERLAKADSLKPKDRVSKRLEAVERTQGIWRDVPDFEEIEA
ncbi:MAG: Eco57I restriction-modification methylase domain-containing protein [Pyrinomonadaceae bacterium]